MSLFKFRLQWEDDFNVIRDIEILSTQTFFDLHEIVKKSFGLHPKMESVIYTSNEAWKKIRALSSVVEKNLRDAPQLSQKRTPLGALIQETDQKFIYVCQYKTPWEVKVELIRMEEEREDPALFPRCVRQEGLSPAQYRKKPKEGEKEKDAVDEVNGKFDFDKEELINEPLDNSMPEEGDQNEQEEGGSSSFGISDNLSSFLSSLDDL